MSWWVKVRKCFFGKVFRVEGIVVVNIRFRGVFIFVGGDLEFVFFNILD